jgi:hypothetical protein
MGDKIGLRACKIGYEGLKAIRHATEICVMTHAFVDASPFDNIVVSQYNIEKPP